MLSPLEHITLYSGRIEYGEIKRQDLQKSEPYESIFQCHKPNLVKQLTTTEPIEN